MAGVPGFEFASQVLPPRHPQFRDDFRMLRSKPVLKFVQCLDGREDTGGNFNGFDFHGSNVTRFNGKRKVFPLHTGTSSTAGGSPGGSPARKNLPELHPRLA